MKSKSFINFVFAFSLLLSGCGGEVNYSENNPTITPADTDAKVTQAVITEAVVTEKPFESNTLPPVTENFDTPRGSGNGEYFHIPTWEEKVHSDRIFQVRIFSEENSESIYNDILGMEEVEKVVKLYYDHDAEFEVYPEDINPELVKYRLSEYGGYLSRPDGKVREQIKLYTYEDCDKYILYHVSEGDYYTGGSYLNYRAGDTLKLTLNNYVIADEIMQEVWNYYAVVIDDYTAKPPEWFLEMSGSGLWMTVPYDDFMQMIDESRDDGVSYEYIIKCKEGEEKGFKEKLETILGDAGQVLNSGFFEDK